MKQQLGIVFMGMKSRYRSRAMIALVTLVCLAFGSELTAQESKPVDSKRLSFENDIIPVLTKMGCNAGKCHGAAIGRGGLALSLYGGNPKSDYNAIVREAFGRRVNLSDPESSLVLQKPTEFVAHGGGHVFGDEHAAAKQILRWLEEGAKFESRQKLKSLKIERPQVICEKPGETFSIKAIAEYSDGSKKNVTKWTVFSSDDEAAVAVEKNSSRAKVLRRGRHLVIARFMTQVVPIEILVPFQEQPIDLTSSPRRNFVDDEILERLKLLAIPPSGQIDDMAFVRRIHLDLTGRLPTEEFVRQQLAGKKRLDREKLIDELLESKEFTQYWTWRFAELLRIRTVNPREGVQSGHSQAGTVAYHKWIQDQIANKVGYDKMVRQLLLAEGDTTKNGPPNFYQTERRPGELAEFAGEFLLGTRIRCANCHNHPLDRWTQDDYHGFAAIFAKVDNRQRIVRTRKEGEVIHPLTQEPAVGRIPGQRFVDAVQGRDALAKWLLRKDNPYFSKVIVNRLWKYMMGRGLVESTDDFRDTNPASHPELLEKLATDFADNGFDIRHSLKTIAMSAAYSRSSRASDRNRADERFYSRAIRRPLPPVVLADAIGDVIGIKEKIGEFPRDLRAVEVPNLLAASETLDALGRCDFDGSCESDTPTAGGLSQQLHLLNGNILNKRIAGPRGNLQTMIRQKRPSIEIVERFYLLALSRVPTEQESAFWSKHLNDSLSAKQRQEKLEDFVWSLLTCEEFRTNH